MEQHIDWYELLNVVSLPFDSEEELAHSLLKGAIYVFKDLLVRFREELPNIKVLIFDVVSYEEEPTQLTTTRYQASNYANFKLDVDEGKEEKPNPYENLSKNIVKGEINV